MKGFAEIFLYKELDSFYWLSDTLSVFNTAKKI